MITKNHSALRLIAILCATLLLTSAALISCKKKDKVSTGPSSSNNSFEYYAHIPEDAYGYLVWDTTKGAFQRFKNSPWGQDQSPMFSVADKLAPELKEIAGIIKEAGIDPFAHDAYEKAFKKGAIYIAPAKVGSENPAVLSVNIEVDSSANTTKLNEALKRGVEKEFGNSTPETYTEGQGFSFYIKDSKSKASSISNLASQKNITGQNQVKVYAGWKGQKMSFATEKSHLETFLSGKTFGMPKIIKSATYAKTTHGFLNGDNRIVEVYIDVAAITNDPNIAKSSSNLHTQLATIPGSALGIVSGMSDTPSGNIRILYNDQLPSVALLKTVLNGSSSPELLKSLPSDMGFFFSLDGKMIREAMKSYALGNSAGSTQLASQLSALESIERIGISAKIAPVGQTMLPLPELLVVIASKDTGTTKAQLKEFFTASVGSMLGLGTKNWQQMQMSGTDIDFITIPGVFSAYLGNTDKLVFFSNAESLTSATLSNSAGGDNSFAKHVSAQVTEILGQRNTVGNLYVNFDQVGSFIESIRGTLSMYAGQSPEVQKLLEPKQIARIKQLGELAGAIEPEKDGIYASMFYQNNSSK